MAERIKLLLEAERRGILPQKEQSLLDEARRRALIPPREETPQPGLIDRGIEAVKGAAQGIGNMVRGETAPGFDFPELSQNLTNKEGKTIPIQGDLSLARGNPIAMANIFQKQFPDANIEFDPLGNPFTSVSDLAGKEKKVFLNKPGLSLGDVNQIITEGGAFLAGGRLGGAAGGLAGPVGAAAGVGAATAGSSELIDRIAQIAGSKQPPDRTRSLIIGALGLGGELVAPLAINFFRAVLSKTSKLFKNGRLTDQGRKVVEDAGIDPDVVTPEFARAFRDEARGAVGTAETAEAAAVAEAQSLPVPVRLSRGDTARTPQAQGFEEAAAEGSLGDPAQKVVQTFREGQQADLRANIPAVQAQIAGGAARVTEPGEGIAAVQARLGADRAALKQSVTTAYETANQLNTSVLSEGVKQLGVFVRRGFSQRFNPLTAPKTSAMVRRLGNFDKTLPGRVATVKVRALENFRQQISALTRSNDPVEAAAAKAVKSSFDDFFDQFIDDAMIRGDAGAVEAFKTARSLRFKLFDKFESNKLVADIIKMEGEEFSLVPSEALNRLFTANALGAKQGAARAISKIKELLGRSSPEFQALKEEGFLRLLSPQTTGNVLDREMQFVFSGDKFATAFKQAMRRAPELMRQLFDTRDLLLIRQFVRVSQRATNKVPGARNPSGTGARIALLSQQLFGAGATVTRAIIQKLTRSTVELGRGIQAEAATTTPLIRPPLLPRGTIGGATSAAASQSSQATNRP